MLWNKSKPVKHKAALILSGGGARAAYQVGVLKAIAEIMPKDTQNPFPILCGTSAGAINATAMAIYSAKFREAVWRLVHVWGNFHVPQVFRSDFVGLGGVSARWFASMVLGGLGKYNPTALLDRSPLRRLLGDYLPMEQIQMAIDQGHIDALSITASSYNTGHSVAFFQGADFIDEWARARRRGTRTTLTLDHLMASSAIPFVFSARKIGDEYFGDGTMRQTAPLSPALHLGADRLFVIGVRHEGDDEVEWHPDKELSLGQLAGHVLDSIFLDNVDMDVERMLRINKTFSQIPDRHIPDDSATLRQVGILDISPSRDLYKIADKHAHLMPRAVRFFLRGLGVSKQHGSNLLSYLLFEKEYCRELIALGYGDALHRKDEIYEFLTSEKPELIFQNQSISHNA